MCILHFFFHFAPAGCSLLCSVGTIECQLLESELKTSFGKTAADSDTEDAFLLRLISRAAVARCVRLIQNPYTTFLKISRQLEIEMLAQTINNRINIIFLRRRLRHSVPCKHIVFAAIYSMQVTIASKCQRQPQTSDSNTIEMNEENRGE